MRRFPRSALALLLVLVLGCQHKASRENPVTKMGLSETVLGRPLIEKAAAFANSWISPDTGIRFAPSWKITDSQEGKGIVAIYAISDVHAPVTYMVAVPVGCRCVFVQPRAYEGWLQDHLSHTGLTLDVSEDRLLAFMLLHEAGHIVHGDPGQFDGSGTGPLNTGTTLEKTREQSADAFVVEQLKRAIGRTKDTDAWMSAQLATVDLANLSFEMLQVREERFFGSESLATPQAFYDLGYTHPNFELRLLTVNDAIANTMASHELLADFLAKRVPRSPVLFQAPAAHPTQ